VTIAFLGDSISDEGRNDPATAPLGVGWVSMVAGNIPSHSVYNKALNGSRIQGVIDRLPEALALKPDCVSAMIGTNERYWMSPDEFREAYSGLAVHLRPIPMRIFCSLIPVDDGFDVKIQQFNEIIREIAKNEAAVHAPTGEQFRASMPSTSSPMLRDGLHPSMAGHLVIADAWLQAVKGRI
jgi:acyl-CoA thioesterase-1